eukprot:637353-Prorocentrum_minimum.AAC.1
MSEARVYSQDDPIRCQKRGYTLTTDQSGREGGAPPRRGRPPPPPRSSWREGEARGRLRGSSVAFAPPPLRARVAAAPQPPPPPDWSVVRIYPHFWHLIGEL